MLTNSLNRKGKNVKIPILIFIVLLGLATFVFSLSFVSDPQINSGNTAYTNDDLVCEWQASPDTIEILPVDIDRPGYHDYLVGYAAHLVPLAQMRPHHFVRHLLYLL